MICKISNFSMWISKHLVQASCTELTLNNCRSRTCKSTSLITLTQNCHYCVQSWFPNDEPISQNDDEAQNHKKMKLLILHSIYVQFCPKMSKYVQNYRLVFHLGQTLYKVLKSYFILWESHIFFFFIFIQSCAKKYRKIGLYVVKWP